MSIENTSNKPTRAARKKHANVDTFEDKQQEDDYNARTLDGQAINNKPEDGQVRSYD